MATRMGVFAKMRPRIKRKGQILVKEAAALISGRTSTNEGAILESLSEQGYAIVHYIKNGFSLKLPGLGTFSPSVTSKGYIKVNLKTDNELLGELNKPVGGFSGDILNVQNIGKSIDELVVEWNEENPDDPVV